MSYSTDNDLYLAFGRDNIRGWADVQNNGIQADIDDRIEWAREEAHDELNSRLAAGPYSMPVAAPPRMLIRIEAYLAGILLNESRSITDVEEDAGDLKNFIKRIDKFVNGIKTGAIKLTDVEPVADLTEVPMAVNYPDPDKEQDAFPDMWDP